MNPIKTYYKSGKIKKETWYENNKCHRLNKPAKIFYDESGEIKTEFWYENDKLHRTNGPADIFYDKEGNIEEEYWFIYGIDETVEIKEWINEYPLPENNTLFKLTWA